MWLDKFKNFHNLVLNKENKILKFDDIALNPIGEKIYFNGIESTRISHPDPNKLLFHVYMPKNSMYERHYHDCREVITIIEGKIYDKDDLKITERLHSYLIDKGKPHTIVALEDTVMYVEFTKI